MPNKDEHINLGFLTGTIGALSTLEPNQDLSIILSKITGCTLGEWFPDLFEPATNPNHRNAFHSIELLGLGILVLLQGNISNEFLKFIVIGYLLHLIQDSQTPDSIPLFIDRLK